MSERHAAQQGMFLSPSDITLAFEIVMVQPDLGPSVDAAGESISRDFAQKIDIPGSLRGPMLRELQKMNITSASLFPGLDGYARSIGEAYAGIAALDRSEYKLALDAIDEVGWA